MPSISVFKCAQPDRTDRRLRIKGGRSTDCKKDGWDRGTHTFIDCQSPKSMNVRSKRDPANSCEEGGSRYPGASFGAPEMTACNGEWSHGKQSKATEHTQKKQRDD
jgi:hypothetical protein